VDHASRVVDGMQCTHKIKVKCLTAGDGLPCTCAWCTRLDCLCSLTRLFVQGLALAPGLAKGVQAFH
jgi:hypothetical protein